MARCGWPLLALAVSGVLWGWLWPAMAEHGRAGWPRCCWLWLTVTNSGWLALLGDPGLIDLACTLLRMRVPQVLRGAKEWRDIWLAIRFAWLGLVCFCCWPWRAVAGGDWPLLALASCAWLWLADCGTGHTHRKC